MTVDRVHSAGHALSYASGPSTTALIGRTIGADLERTVTLHGDREALVEYATGRRWTYAELDAAVDEVARGLLALGLAKGDRVGIWSPNCAEWVLVQYATAKAGLVLVTVNPAYRTHELSYVLQQSGARLLVAAERFRTSDYRAMVQEVRGECPALEQVVLIGTPDWPALLEVGRAVPEQALRTRSAQLAADDPINIQYTSGTTGFPKGATLSHHNILNNGFFVGELCGYTEADRVAIPVPFYHCFGMVMGNLACTSHGAAMVIPAPAFDPLATLRAVQDERCTSLYGVPTMFIAQLHDPSLATRDLTSLRTGIMAGSPCPIETMRAVVTQMHCTEITIGYGQTEASPLITQTRFDDPLELRVETVGRALPGIEVKIIDPLTGETLPDNTPGELCARGHCVMLGYYSQPDATAAAIDPAGWLHTGDIAVRLPNRYFKITGRIKDMVIRGGENIYPREIEEFLFTHPAIEQAAVVGVPDAKYGEELCAWIKLKPSAASEALTDDSIKAFCRGRLAHFKIPRYVKFVTAFPQTVTGKIQKFLIREQMREELGLSEQETA